MYWIISKISKRNQKEIAGSANDWHINKKNQPSPAKKEKNFSYTHRLNIPDDFEDRRSANDENEKADQPRGRRIFIFLRFQRFLHISTGRHIFRINFVGDSATLRGWHFVSFSFSWRKSGKTIKLRKKRALGWIEERNEKYWNGMPVQLKFSEFSGKFATNLKQFAGEWLV